MRHGKEIPERVEVKFAIDAEGSSGGVHAGQFAESHGNGVSEEGRDDIAEDYAGARHFEGGGRAEKKSGADGAADRHHGHLAGGELMVQTLFVDEVGAAGD